MKLVMCGDVPELLHIVEVTLGVSRLETTSLVTCFVRC
jgi:hypothetical protein